MPWIYVIHLSAGNLQWRQ